MRNQTFVAIVALAFCLSCSPNKPEAGITSGSSQASKVTPLTSEQLAKEATDFGSYWNRGLAEMNRFKLSQTRYGELHEGEAVAIFVTEDFLTDKQVKFEFGPRTNAVPILKMNQHRRFYTGVYPYNVNSSVFSPLNEDAPQKLVFSATEWCGQVFAQFNRSDAGYNVQSFSYFQAESDQKFELESLPFEDAMWVQVRKDPKKLPTGELMMIPSIQFLRFMHKETKPYAAIAAVETNQSLKGWDAKLSRYTVEYPELKRTFHLYFEPQFPYRIVGFEDGYSPLFSRNGPAESMVSRGVLTNSIMLDYWSKNSNADAPYRDALGLEEM